MGKKRKAYVRRPWAQDEVDLVREKYADRPTREIAAALWRCVGQVYQKAGALGLRKSAAFFASPESGILRRGEQRPEAIPHQFPKGHVPANKGLRRPGWAPGRMRETQFRRGQRSGAAARNWRAVGTVLADPEGYLRIKVREAEHGKESTGFGNVKVWPLYSRYLWEQANGPIPAKHIVAFRDGDRQNCVLDNLQLMSMADNARRNHWKNRLPPDLAQVIMLTGAIKRKLREAVSGKEHDR